MKAKPSLYRLWFQNPKWWFDPHDSFDDLITEQFQHLLDSDSQFTFNRNTSISLDLIEAIEYILIHDQLPRHVYRKEPADHIIAYHLIKAQEVSQHILEQYTYWNTAISATEWCFIMLPLRHSNKFKLCNQTLQNAWDLLRMYRENDAESYTTIKRFIKATYQHMPNASRDIDFEYHEHYPSKKETRRCCYEFDIDLTPYSRILKFAPTTATLMLDIKSNNTLLNSFKPFVNDFLNAVESSGGASTFIISLSGGVDSMLCSYLAYKLILQKSRHDKNNRKHVVHAVHVNYKNKKDCDVDEEFVREWCFALQIPLTVRRIHEIQRTPCMANEMRDIYETYTRNVRYSTYKHVAQMYNNDVDGNRTEMPCVILGHNKDDCFENILTNLSYVQKYENLKGMTTIARQDGIMFVRPLLDRSKLEIRKCAEDNMIPHLHDSTPTWSQRGKIRDIVVPALNEMDHRCIPGMFQLSNVMTELHEIVDNNVERWCKNTKTQGDQPGPTRTARLDIELSELTISLLHWKKFLSCVTGMCPPTKSLGVLTSHLSQCKRTNIHPNKYNIVVSKHVSMSIATMKNNIELCIRWQ
jgi:tRNA(Ile)-lysidine synthetase-like protein